VVSEIVLLRHGQASFGAEDYDRLSDVGQTQVRLLGEHLAELGMEFDAIYSGAMRRQRDSVRLMLEAMGHSDPGGFSLLHQFNEFEHLPVLREYLTNMAERGEPEVDIQRLGQDRAYFQAVFDAATSAWIAGDLEEPGMESWLQFCQRIEDGLQTLQRGVSRGGRVLVSTSAGAISVALQSVLGTPRQEALRLAWVIRNSSLTRILWDGKRASLEMFNSVAHLERGDRSELITYR
jgi:broad specificity phosphatase PhoE